MVKAEAYGLGLEAVSLALRDFPREGDPWAFGVAAVSEGLRLRDSGWDGRVIVFSPTPSGEYRSAGEAGLTLCLSDLNAVRRLASVARDLGHRIPFHLEIDTGMGRSGFPWRDVVLWGAEVVGTMGDQLFWEATFTHFHSADEPDLASTDRQWERWCEAVSRLPALEPRPVEYVANSAVTLRRGGYGCALARPGIFLYGGRAGAGTEPATVASVRAKLVLIRRAEAGDTVGYGATWTAKGDEVWGTLAIGYGDGIPRALSPGGGQVIVRGHRVPIIGRVSMDMITIDLTTAPDAEEGDIATLIGLDGAEEITVDEVAARCGTISYEILTGLTSRLPRVYLDGELEVAFASNNTIYRAARNSGALVLGLPETDDID
jgi:alanine racemase